MTDRELMQMALEALRKCTAIPTWPSFMPIIKDLEARLAQPEPEELGEIVPANEEQLKRIAKLVEPEPVAWYYAGSDVEPNSVALEADLDAAQKANCIPLYTAPPQREWQGMTDEEIMDACSAVWASHPVEVGQVIAAKLKEKNT